jgi:signal transduction histidine kinase
MNKEKENQLNNTLSRAVNMGFGLESSDHLEEVFSDKIMVIGTAIEEKYTTLDGLRKLIQLQQEQSHGMELNFIRTEVYRDYPADENMAILVEDIRLNIQSNDDITGFDMRASAVLEYKNNNWKLIHWHISKPEQVQSEVDTFGIEEWKQKTEILEKLVAERTAALMEKNEELEAAMTKLKATQSQLIQSEKMASLGELTAGIAHEIQNPLNFVNNFSEVNIELIGELKDEKAKAKSERDDLIEDDLLNDIAQNLEKINHHGKRADGIVKGMLQHSRSSTGQKEPTDINALADEYLRLAYHGLRAKDKSFNVTLKTEFDESLSSENGKINIIPQDMGRVILNLITNAFYAVSERKKQGIEGYEPIVTIRTKKINERLEISVKDNGTGIPPEAIQKIFQPFFTTKPTGQGTGLGLSMSYDIITKGHAGELTMKTLENEGTEFMINIPT